MIEMNLEGMMPHMLEPSRHTVVARGAPSGTILECAASRFDLAVHVNGDRSSMAGNSRKSLDQQRGA